LVTELISQIIRPLLNQQCDIILLMSTWKGVDQIKGACGRVTNTYLRMQNSYVAMT